MTSTGRFIIQCEQLTEELVGHNEINDIVF